LGAIVQRRRNNGSIGYTAQIRLKHDGALVRTEAPTVGKKALATKWLRRHESEHDWTKGAGPATVGKRLYMDWPDIEVGTICARHPRGSDEARRGRHAA
jgi:hypothetical protein